MNIFYLDTDPVKSAELHCDKHVVKMIIEYAQLMSTAHRVLDVSNVGVSITATWRMFSTRHHTSIILQTFGFDLVIHTINLYMICSLRYAMSILIGMAKHT
jgi:hypothetical protein